MKAFVFFCAGALLGGFVLFAVGYGVGEREGEIMTGSPAYFCIENIAQRIEKEDPALQQDLQDLINTMDRKNTSGVNGPAMSVYVRKQ